MIFFMYDFFLNFIFTFLYIDNCLILFVNFNKIFIVIYTIFAACHNVITEDNFFETVARSDDF